MPKFKFKLNAALLIPAATAAWAVGTWASDLARERRREQARLSALYVTPFLSACEDLQSRIYSIMELDGLATLRRRYPDGSYADETLYLVARYFGWMVAVQRHGPYTNDPQVIRLVSAVASGFASSSSPRQVGPFNFFHAEQKALGKLVMSTTEVDVQLGVELDSLSYYEFKKRLASPPLSDSLAMTETLEALRGADRAQVLAGRERLVRVQHHLVDLLDYLEGSLGYSLFCGKRKKCGQPTQLRIAAGNGPQQPKASPDRSAG